MKCHFHQTFSAEFHGTGRWSLVSGESRLMPGDAEQVSFSMSFTYSSWLCPNRPSVSKLITFLKLLGLRLVPIMDGFIKNCSPSIAQCPK